MQLVMQQILALNLRFIQQSAVRLKLSPQVMLKL